MKELKRSDDIAPTNSPYHVHALSVPGGTIYEFWTYAPDELNSRLTQTVFVPWNNNDHSHT